LVQKRNKKKRWIKNSVGKIFQLDKKSKNSPFLRSEGGSDYRLKKTTMEKRRGYHGRKFHKEKAVTTKGGDKKGKKLREKERKPFT